jgi:hypothetical protein
MVYLHLAKSVKHSWDIWFKFKSSVELNSSLYLLIDIMNYLINFDILWNSMFLAFSFIIEGTSKKALQFLMPLEPIFNKNIFLMNKNVYYENCRKV